MSVIFDTDAGIISIPYSGNPNIFGTSRYSFSSSQARFLLKEHCDATQLYLQHDLTLQQLAQTIGTNRNYLSQYFSRQGITYNTYINNLRINHFINCYQEVAGSKQPFSVQQLACENVLYIFGNATFLTATMP